MKHLRDYLTAKQQQFIKDDLVITDTCFMGLIVCEYHSKDKQLKVTYHSYKFLGGGISLWYGCLHHNNKIIFKADEHEKLLKAYSLKLLELTKEII